VLFPIKGKNNQGLKRARDAGLYKEKASVAKKAASERLKELNNEFSSKYNLSFEDAAARFKRGEKQIQEKKVIRKVKDNIESQWKETSVLRFVRVKVL